MDSPKGQKTEKQPNEPEKSSEKALIWIFILHVADIF